MKIYFNNLIPNTYKKKNVSSVFFQGFNCSESDFEIKKLYNMPCPICAVPMIQRNQIDDFVNGIQNKTGKDLIEILTKYQKYFHPIELNASEMIINESKKYPKKNISELAQICHFKEFELLKQERIEFTERIEKLASQIPQKKQAEANKAIEELKKIILSEDYIDKESLIEDFKNKIDSKHPSGKKIIRQLQKFPQNNSGSYKFLSKYAKTTQAEIASRLVTPSLATCDHIRPKNLGGIDNTENYLTECEECNSKKSNADFYDWASSVPRLTNNLKNYINALGEKIETGLVSIKFADYIDDLVSTISKETKGKISIEAPKLRILEAEDNKFDIESEKNKVRKELENLKKDLEEYEKKSQTTDKNAVELINEYRILVNQKRTLEIRKDAKEKEISRKQITIDKYCKKYNEYIEKKGISENNNGAIRVQASELRKLSNFLNSKNPEEIQNEIKLLKEELSEIKNKLSNCDNRISFLETQINFPEKYKAEIKKLKTQIQTRKTLEIEVRRLKNFLKENLNIRNEIEAKEKKIFELESENKSIDISNYSIEEVEQYELMLDIIKKASIFEETSKHQSKNTSEKKIYELAKEKAKETINSMYENSSYIRHRVNLDVIENLIEELKILYDKEAKNKNSAENINELEKELAKYPEKEELEQEIETLNKKLEEAENLFESTSIDSKIENIQREIKRKEKILVQLQKENITEDEARRIYSYI